MQFYIVDKDPLKSAELLPDYALKMVNIREGWQILSDIGHRFGFMFEGQNKHYNMYHPLTRSFSNKEDFKILFNNYHECCLEHAKRFKKETEHILRFKSNFTQIETIAHILPKDTFEEVRHYLTTSKRKHLTESEVERI